MDVRKKKYATLLFDQNAKTGTIASKVGVTPQTVYRWKKEYDCVPTGQSASFSIKTNLGSTKVTIKIWSVNGSADEGLQGQFKITY